MVKHGRMKNMSEPRQYTAEEVRDMLISAIWENIEYWEHESRQSTVRDKLEGLAFSILSMLDGSQHLPGFVLITETHPSDKDYFKSQGKNWFPENDTSSLNEPLAFMLHEDFYSKRLRKDK